MRFLPLAMAFLTAGLSGCSIVDFFQDSPTELTLSTPIDIAAAGTSIIFKDAHGSDNCVFYGDLVTSSARPGPKSGPGTPIVTLTYGAKKGEKEASIFRVVSDAGTVTVKGTGQYALSTRKKKETSRITLDRLGPKTYRVRVVGPGLRDLFHAIVLVRGGTVYLRNGTFLPPITSYAIASPHNCSDWNTEAEGTLALEREQARVPK